ncbi:hypothetical protein J8281_11610 [Aquimarina sp. U1-2]|uniref:PulJ/GspJ family protein n=1 Tax=Aquimarina sp. U1-2 TaxID=2823141 RepID=UPI001AECC178|nr:hypothetical protein [Aquimarina sp. U1-2]MBP2832833.1 hypothetical protein [Aquimarina sp. U1-2]
MLAYKKHTRLSAFTILELVIGITISSLVITMVYVIYDNLSRQVITYSRQQDELMIYHQFEGLFSKDIQLSKKLSVIDKAHIVLDMHDKEIHYFFKNDEIIRKEETLDTFRLKVMDVNFKSEEKIEEKCTRVRLKTKLLGADFEIFESKEISLAQRMNDYLLDEY